MTQVIRGLINVPAEWPGCVATIGNFDGLHRGHQALIAALKARAKLAGLPSVVLTFLPLPAEYFAGRGLTRLSDFREKFRALEALGVDYLCICYFTKAFAALSADQFIRTVLEEALQVKHLIIGDDFRFGQKRAGDVDTLKAAGSFTVEAMSTVMVTDERVSSTLLRQALAAADFQQAERLLGHPYCMRGRVVHGDKRGRELGFPTANFLVKRDQAPLSGVYIVRLHGVGSKALPGVASIGVRPTFGVSRCLLEVHVFDYAGSLYGLELSIEFCQKLREEKRFDTIAALQAAMHEDARLARAFHHLPV